MRVVSDVWYSQKYSGGKVVSTLGVVIEGKTEYLSVCNSSALAETLREAADFLEARNYVGSNVGGRFLNLPIPGGLLDMSALPLPKKRVKRAARVRPSLKGKQ